MNNRFKANSFVVSFMLGSALLLVAVVPFNLGIARADQVTNRSLTLSTSAINAINTSYNLGFNINNFYMLGSIVLEICNEDPLPNNPCTSPTGYDASAVTLNAESGETGFVVDAASTINRTVIGRSPIMTTPGSLSYTFGNITNPSNIGTYYGRIYTYASSDGTGIPIDVGGIAFSINNTLLINTEVPPYLEFCAAELISGFDCQTAIDNYALFGNFSSSSVATTQSQIMMVTNAQNGLSVSIAGNTLTSGNNEINAAPIPSLSNAGTSQFGINLVANSNPQIGSDVVGPGIAVANASYAIPNNFMFNSGDTIVNSTNSTDWRKFTVSYIANVSSNQAPGVYTSTFTYICLANF